MMDVMSAHLNPTERPTAVDDRCDQQPHHNKGKEEANRGQEEPPMRPIGNALVDQHPKLRQVQQQENQDGQYTYEDQQHPGTRNVHTEHYGWATQAAPVSRLRNCSQASFAIREETKASSVVPLGGAFGWRRAFSAAIKLPLSLIALAFEVPDLV
jgi:hypothetical protein